MKRAAANVAVALAALGLLRAAISAQEPPTIPPLPAQQEPIGQINGTVFDGARKGVAGLPVTLLPLEGAAVHGTSTDVGGRYGFKGLETGTYNVVVTLPEGGALRKDGIRIRPLFRSIVDFTLPAQIPPSSLPGVGASDPLTMSVIAKGADRSPVPDALITLTPVEGRGRFHRGRTGPDGACAIADLPAGQYRISVKAPGFLTWSLGPIALGGPGAASLSLALVPYPMGFQGTIEDLLVPVDPIPPAASPGN